MKTIYEECKHCGSQVIELIENRWYCKRCLRDRTKDENK